MSEKYFLIDIKNEDLKKFLELKQTENASISTLKYYKNVISNYLDFIQNNYDKINVDSIVAFLNSGVRKKYNSRSRNLLGIVIRSFANYLYEKGKIKNEIKIKFDYKPPAVKGVDVDLIKEYIEKGSLLDKAILTFMLSSGLRKNEILSLRVKDLDFEKLEGKVRGKGQKEGEEKQIFVFSKQAKEYLIEYLKQRNAKPEDPLFLNEDSKPFTSYTFWKYFKEKFKINPHKLRHTFCFLASKKYTPTELQFLARHKSYETTKRYIEADALKLIRERRKEKGDVII
jgi:integrase/recombinase XerD